MKQTFQLIIILFSLVAKDARWSYFYHSLTFPITTVLANGTDRNWDNWLAGNGHVERVSLTEHSNYVGFFFFPFCKDEMNKLGEKYPSISSDEIVPPRFTSKKAA